MIRPIVDTLRHLEGGTFLDEVSEAMAKVVLAVSESGKAGSVTMKIDVRRATAGAMAVRGTFTTKCPSEPPVEALLFATPEGNLLTEDPSQRKLEFNPTVVEKLEIIASGTE